MTRDQVTVPLTPARRPAFRQAGIVGQETGQEASPYGRSTQDWVQQRNDQRIQDFLNERSNSGDGRDAVRASAAAQTVTYTSAGSGVQVRVPHTLFRTPSAITFFRTADPNHRVVGVPAGRASPLPWPNSPWTNREVYLNSNAPAGTVFEVDIG